MDRGHEYVEFRWIQTGRIVAYDLAIEMPKTSSLNKLKRLCAVSFFSGTWSFAFARRLCNAMADEKQGSRKDALRQKVPSLNKWMFHDFADVVFLPILNVKIVQRQVSKGHIFFTNQRGQIPIEIRILLLATWPQIPCLDHFLKVQIA